MDGFRQRNLQAHGSEGSPPEGAPPESSPGPFFYPRYGRGERIADLCIHLAGVSLGAVGVAVLLGTALRTGSPLHIVSLAIYGLALLAMLTCSAAYNLTRPSPAKELLRRLDHAAIFAMIAGTYTPLTLLILQGTVGTALFAFVWAAAIAGMGLKILRPRRFERTGLVLYLLLGWCGVVTVGSLVAVLPSPALLLLGAGCLLYSIGVVFHLRERLPYANAIWHAFVLGAAACHYALMLGHLALPGPGR